MKKQEWISLIIAGLVVGLSGCAAVPVGGSGFLDNYAGMSKEYGLDEVRVDPETDLSSYDTLVISPIDTQFMNKELIAEDEAKVLKKLKESFRVEMARYFENVVMDNSFQGKGKVLRLDLAVTQLRPTDVLLNLAVGLCAGNATGSIEGRFVDVSTGREVIAFIDTRKGSPFSKKEFNAAPKLPNWSELEYLYLFAEIWAENVSKIVSDYTEEESS